MYHITLSIDGKEIDITCVSYLPQDDHYVLNFGVHSHIYPKEVIKNITPAPQPASGSN